MLDETAAVDEIAMRSARQGVYDVDSDAVDGPDRLVTNDTPWGL